MIEITFGTTDHKLGFVKGFFTGIFGTYLVSGPFQNYLENRAFDKCVAVNKKANKEATRPTD